MCYVRRRSDTLYAAKASPFPYVGLFSISVLSLTTPGGGFPVHNESNTVSHLRPTRSHSVRTESPSIIHFKRETADSGFHSCFFTATLCPILHFILLRSLLLLPQCLHSRAFAPSPTKRNWYHRGSYAAPPLLRPLSALASSSVGNYASQTWRGHLSVPLRRGTYYSNWTSLPWILCKTPSHSTGGSLGMTAMIAVLLSPPRRTPHVLSLTYM